MGLEQAAACRRKVSAEERARNLLGQVRFVVLQLAPRTHWVPLLKSLVVDALVPAGMGFVVAAGVALAGTVVAFCRGVFPGLLALKADETRRHRREPYVVFSCYF